MTDRDTLSHLQKLNNRQIRHLSLQMLGLLMRLTLEVVGLIVIVRWALG